MGPARLKISPHHANVRIARLVLASVCRLAKLPEPLMDDIRLATGEACGRAVSAHRDHRIDDQVVVEIEADESSVTVEVQDQAPGGPGEPAEVFDANHLTSLRDALAYPDALAIIGGLVDDLEVRTSPSGSTVVMRWNTADQDA